MTITAVFEDLNEVKEFAEMFCGRDARKEAPAQAGGDTAAVTPQPVQNTQAPVQPQVQNAQAPVQPPVQNARAQPAAAVPVTAAQYTLDDLARAGMTLMDAGRQADLQGLLSRFGVEALPMLEPGQYGAFATALREMGAQI